MQIKLAAENFTKALVDLIEAISGNVSASKVTEEATEETEEKEWPDNFSSFRKAWIKAVGDKAEGFAGSVFGNASCLEFTPEKIEMVLLGDPAFEASAMGKEGKAAVLAELREHLGFEGELVIRGSGPTSAKGKATSPKGKAGASKTEVVITAEQVAKACMELAVKLDSKEKVVEVLKRFGGTSAKQIDKSKYPAILDALTNYSETTTASGGISAEDF